MDVPDEMKALLRSVDIARLVDFHERAKRHLHRNGSHTKAARHAETLHILRALIGEGE